MLGGLSAAMTVVLAMGQVAHGEDHIPPVSEFGGFDSTAFGGELSPYDTPYPWVPGYFQEIPAYGGYAGFRPYNDKHVLSQSQAAGGWGMSPTMPYSQQFWHRYHHRATLQAGDFGHAPLPRDDYPVTPMSEHQPRAVPQVPSYPELFYR